MMPVRQKATLISAKEANCPDRGLFLAYNINKHPLSPLEE